MSVDFDAKLTGLAAEVLRHAVQDYDPVFALGPDLAARDFTMLGSFDATGSFRFLPGPSVLTGSFVAAAWTPRRNLRSRSSACSSCRANCPVSCCRPSRNSRPWPVPLRSSRARALARWLGPDGRFVTGTDDLAMTTLRTRAGNSHRAERLSSLWSTRLSRAGSSWRIPRTGSAPGQ